jgi:uncharacterized tellurite resistance protein B-like protein
VRRERVLSFRMSRLAESFSQYLQALTDESAPWPTAVIERDLQVATTVLLVQVLRADLSVKSDEIEAVAKGVEDVLGLGPGEAVELMRLAARHARTSDALRLAVDRLDQHLTRAQRVELVEWLWRIAFADAELLGSEEYLVRKVADLLGLSTADLIEAKVRAKEAL